MTQVSHKLKLLITLSARLGKMNFGCVKTQAFTLEELHFSKTGVV